MSVFPSNFDQFYGNSNAVENLRASIAAGRLPHSLIIAGPRGAGKFTLALMLTMALECERQPREGAADARALASFCGACRNCTRIAESAALDERVEEAVAAREEMRDADKKDTRVLVQTHPDVLILPPDPPQLLIKLGQVRTLIGRAHYVPTEAPAKVFIITSSSFMKEAANSLLKTLEEPPASAHIILLTENVSELLPTIRSRCAITRLGALPKEDMEALLAERRPEVSPKERALLARLSEGAAGRALQFDLAAYVTARTDALIFVRNAMQAGDHSPLFRMTETYRAGAEGQTKRLIFFALWRAFSKTFCFFTAARRRASATSILLLNCGSSLSPFHSSGSKLPCTDSMEFTPACVEIYCETSVWTPTPPRWKARAADGSSILRNPQSGASRFASNCLFIFIARLALHALSVLACDKRTSRWRT